MEFMVDKQERLIKFLARNVQGLSYANLQKSLRLGKVKVNGKRVKENILLNEGDKVFIFIVKKNMPQIEIVYKNDNLLIVNKPAGIECALKDKSSNSAYSLEEIFAQEGAIVVHRLDRLTEGLTILARNKQTAECFDRFFKEHRIEKKYLACVNGILKEEGKKVAYLKKNASTGFVKISLTPKPEYKEIITEFKVKSTFDKYSILDITLHTGRTHQIRAYFSFLGNSVVGDTKYSTLKNEINNDYKGYFLTAYQLKFNLPDQFSYLNSLEFNIVPTWLKYTNKGI